MRRWMMIWVLAGSWLLASCETTEVALDRQGLDGIRTVAVLEVDRGEGVGPAVAEAVRDSLQGALLAAGMRVVERSKILQIMEEKEFSLDMGAEDGAALGALSGADALVFARILQYRESLVSARDPDGNPYQTEFYEFLVQVRMTSVSDGSLVLTVKNTRTSHQNDPRFIRVESLDQFVGQVLDGLETDLVKALERR